MEPLTRFVASSDGTRIAYDIQGHGPALILLPGLGRGFSRRTWPIVEPQEALCPMLIYFGSNNNSLERVLERRGELKALGMHLHVFDGLNHLQELTGIDTVLPPVLAFLKAQSG